MGRKGRVTRRGAARVVVVRVLIVVVLGVLFSGAYLVIPVLDPPERDRTPSSGGQAAAADEPDASGPVAPDGATIGPQRRPNIVVVVLDDFSLELVRTMPVMRRMARTGADFENAFVVNSLCCPSRAAIFEGRPPHLTGVTTNTSDTTDGVTAPGGYEAFREHNGPRRSYNVALRRSGYTTGFVGKYLNEYEPGFASDGLTRLPPELVGGWDDFESISGGGYSGFGFYRTYKSGGALALEHYPTPPVDASDEVKDASYATNVVADRAVDLVREYRRDYRRTGAPYLLHVAPYATHARLGAAYPGDPRFPAAFADRAVEAHPDGSCGALRCSRLSLRDLLGYLDPREDNVPAYSLPDGTTTPAPPWRTNAITLTDNEALTEYRDRARMAQSVDRMLSRLQHAIGPETYLVVTSDNGFHLGQHSLNAGKGTPYDSDTHVPLLVTGPRVPQGAREGWVSSIDIAPTIEELAGLVPDKVRAGTSFLPQLRSPSATGNRYVFFEHRYGPALPGEPDAEPGSGLRLDIIPSYVAVRSEQGLLVRFDLDKSEEGTDYAWELYRYDVPWEDVNVFAADHDAPWVQDLRRRVEAWDGCAKRLCQELAR